MGINHNIYNPIYLNMTPDQIEKAFKELRRIIRCLSCDVNELASAVNELASTSTSTTTTTTEAP